MGIEKEIKNELDKLRNIKAQIEKTLQNAPEEKLRCAINNGYYQYYIGKEYQGAGKKELVKKIARKEYCCQLNQNIYKNLHPGRKQLVEPLIKPVEEIIEEFERIERVRSKSEKIIADELYRCNIPYKYEMPIQLKSQNKIVTVYPDFTVMNKCTGKNILWNISG